MPLTLPPLAIAQAQQDLRAQLLNNTAVLGALVALLGSEHPAGVRTAASGALAVLAATKEGAQKMVHQHQIHHLLEPFP